MDCPPLATSRSAEFIPWQDGHVLKLYKAGIALDHVHAEMQQNRALADCGLPVPVVVESASLDGRHGLVYRWHSCTTLWDMLIRQPLNLYHYAARMAALHVEVHNRRLDIALPAQRKVLTERIEGAGALDELMKERVLELLASLPDGRQLCHGDFWPGNILVSPGGEAIIDWEFACCGNPLGDVAHTALLGLNLSMGLRFVEKTPVEDPSSERWLVRLLLHWFGKYGYPRYASLYRRLKRFDAVEYRGWLAVAAAARLAEGIPQLEASLLKIVRRGLKQAERRSEHNG